jgi:hypothetical protein
MHQNPIVVERCGLWYLTSLWGFPSCSSTIELHPREAADSISVHHASATVRDCALGSGGVQVQIGARDPSAGGIACLVVGA